MAQRVVLRGYWKGWFWKAAQLALLVLLFLPSVTAIKCYVCENAVSNDECNQDEHLIDCNDQSIASTSPRLDTCMTTSKKTDGSVRITKKCVTGPCSLDDNQGNALALNRCDRTGDNWTCEGCCGINGCNKAAGVQIRVNLALMLGAGLLCAMPVLRPWM